MSKINDFLQYQLGQGKFFDNTKAPSFCDAIHEINTGQKNGLWTWYIMPTNNKSKTFGYKFALNDEETIAYLKNPTLYNNYLEFMRIVNQQLNNGLSSIQLFVTKLDVIKLYDSINWFRKFLRKSDQLYNILEQINLIIEPEIKFYMLDSIIDFQNSNIQKTKYLTAAFNDLKKDERILI